LVWASCSELKLPILPVVKCLMRSGWFKQTQILCSFRRNRFLAGELVCAFSVTASLHGMNN